MKPFFSKTMKSLGGGAGVCLFLIALFVTYCCSQMLEWDQTGNLIAHSYSVWGDWSVHFTFISQFRERGWHWIFSDNPLFQGTPFRYPFLSHLLTEGFALFGSFLGFWGSQEVVVPTFILSLLLIFILPFAIFYGIRSLGVPIWTSVMATFIFLFSGGVEFLDSAVNPNFPLTNQPGGPFFTNFLLFEFFPQRAFLFGIISLLMMGGMILRNPSYSRVILGLLLFPFLLCLHVHSWIAMAILLMCLLICHPKANKRRDLFKFGFGIAFISVVLMKVYLFRESQPAALKEEWPLFSPGWFPDQPNLFSFWLYQTGTFIPLALYGFYLHRKNAIFKPFFGTGAIIFILAFFVRPQPAAYDNLKLFTYSFLFLSPFVALALESFLRNKFKAPLAFLLLISLTASGLSDAVFFSKKKENALFFSRTEFDLAKEWKTLRSSSDETVIIAPKHNHWVPCLSGSPVWMGYAGWLWSWGINYRPREQEVKEVLLGTASAKKIIEAYHLHYAIFNQADQIDRQQVNLAYFENNYKTILSKSGWFAFDLTQSAH